MSKEGKVANPQSRKWLITINNPLEKNYTHDVILEKLNGFKGLVYYCMADEIGESGTYHTHIYLVVSGGLRFSTLKKTFEGGHFDISRGTSQQNRDYVFKEGKWLESEKKETNLVETHKEFGDMPIERQGQRNDLHDLYDMIKSGMSNFEILENDPSYIRQLERLDKLRQMFKEEEFKTVFRNLDVSYIYGVTGSGKTRGVMEKYGYENVYRITSYDKHPWDAYMGQDVVVFEEFRSSFRIQEMLNYLDGYPLQLPARYNHKIACFTKIYILSNISLKEQYEEVQEKYPETFNAFTRRIHNVSIYTGNEIIEYTTPDYLKSIHAKLSLDDVVAQFQARNIRKQLGLSDFH